MGTWRPFRLQGFCCHAQGNSFLLNPLLEVMEITSKGWLYKSAGGSIGEKNLIETRKKYNKRQQRGDLYRRHGREEIQPSDAPRVGNAQKKNGRRRHNKFYYLLFIEMPR